MLRSVWWCSHWQFLPVLFLKLWRGKGVECHKAIIEGYLQSMEFGQEDVVIWLDVCPNQFFASI